MRTFKFDYQYGDPAPDAATVLAVQYLLQENNHIARSKTHDVQIH